MKFKVGDTARCLIDLRAATGIGKLLDGTDAPTIGDILTVTGISNDPKWPISAVFKGSAICFREDELELLETNTVITTSPTQVITLPTKNHVKSLGEVVKILYGSPIPNASSMPIRGGHVPVAGWDTEDKVPYIESSPSPNHKCECGVDSIGGGKHSSYCPKSLFN